MYFRQKLKMLHFVTVLALITIMFVGSARAEDREGRRSDMIVLKLSEELQLITESPLVQIDVILSFDGKDASAVRQQVMSALSKFGDGSEWQITSFERDEEDSGLESWLVAVEARVPEAKLAALTKSVDKHSRAGFKIEIVNLNWSATHQEQQAAQAKLRKAIYARAKSELDAANEAFPDRNYRIGLINLGVEKTDKIAGLARKMNRLDEVVVTAQRRSSGLGVTETLSMEAVILLEASAPAQ